MNDMDAQIQAAMDRLVANLNANNDEPPFHTYMRRLKESGKDVRTEQGEPGYVLQDGTRVAL